MDMCVCLYKGFNILIGAKFKSMVRCVVTSILHGGPIELFLIPSQCSTTGVTKTVVYAILSVG